MMMMLSSNLQSISSESPRLRRRKNFLGKRTHTSPTTVLRHFHSSRHVEDISSTNIFQATASTRIQEVKCAPKEGEQNQFKVRRCNETCNRNFTRNCGRACNCYTVKRICRDSKDRFRFVNDNGEVKEKGCPWVKRKNTEERCAINTAIARLCFATCNPMKCQERANSLNE